MKTLYVAVALAFLPILIKAQDTTRWSASQETIARLSKLQPGINYYEEKVPAYTLPDVLTSDNGRKIETQKQWTKIRRPEVLELFRKNVYGRVPKTPYSKSYKVVNENPNAMNGDATLKQIEITITAEAKSLVIHLTLFVPNRVKKPVPAFLLINNRGTANTDPTRKVKSEFWPAEELIARGYAISAFYNADVDPDKFDDFKDGIHGLLDKDKRSEDSWGTIAAWAWGASRCLDYLETDKDIAADRVAVVGHSRGGKTALWAGAEDQRFAMVVSNESGAGGAALSRRRYGETVAASNKLVSYWYCSNYKKYINNEDSLPTDQHMLLSLIAPRGLYVACASEDLWGDPRGSYLALYHSVPVFKLLQTGTDLSLDMPPLNTKVQSGKVAYHIRDGVHNMLVKDWNWFMDFGDVVLK
ncbi:MAG: prolyl oligopeptidase family serine peptidase [Bacteroidia bacterium]|nr:prolyl oligopeptidase family serine peptidase [Bacteroidia bacterium]